MASGGVECIAGVHRDPVFGPVLMFGLGGIHVETLRDVALRVLPVTREDTLAMVRELRAFAILDGAARRRSTSRRSPMRCARSPTSRCVPATRWRAPRSIR